MGAIRGLIPLAVLPFLFIQSATACKAEWKVTAFEGLKSVDIFISSLDDDAKKAGFTEEELKNAIELKLRQNGIKGRDIHDISDSEPSFLYLRLNVMYIEKDAHYVYGIDLCFVQPVRLLRNDNVLIAKTWDQNYLGIELPSRIRNTVNSCLDDLLIEFLNTYHESNPYK
jgi:hypothetical protein